MAIDPTVLRAMEKAGASLEVILAAIEADAKIEAEKTAIRRARDNDRQRKSRENRRGGKRSQVVTPCHSDPLIEENHIPGSVISPDGEKQNKPRKQRGRAGVRPGDIPEQLWEAWVDHRASHRADISETTINAFRREADRVGWTLEQAMTEQISRGWRGFKAKWVQDDGRSDHNNRNGSGAGIDRRSTLARAIDEGIDWLGGAQAQVS